MTEVTRGPELSGVAARERRGGGAGRPPASWRLLGVLRADRAAAARDLPGVEVVTSGPLAAALVPHDEGSLRDALVEHAELLAALHARAGVLPARYGTVAADPADVAAGLLDPNRDALDGLLADVDGRDEVRIRVYQVEQAAIEAVATADPDVAGLRAAAGQAGGGADGLPSGGFRLALGQRVAAGLAALAEADAALVLGTLTPLAAGVSGDGPAGGALVLDASFLVDRSRAADFDRAVGNLVDRLGARARLRAVGPLPPYRFAAAALRVGAGPGREGA